MLLTSTPKESYAIMLPRSPDNPIQTQSSSVLARYGEMQEQMLHDRLDSRWIHDNGYTLRAMKVHDDLSQNGLALRHSL